MATSDFTTTLLVDQSPTEVFQAILNVRGWWSESIQDKSAQLDDEFIFSVAGVHDSTQKLIELIPDQKIVWLVTASKLSFIKDQGEWTGTKLCFDIATKNQKTEIRFTHMGLLPTVECYNACSNAWRQIMHESLLLWITTGEVKTIF